MDLSVYDHVRPEDGDHEAGIYRVVGTGEGTVTLLRVGDPDNRRVNTGHVVTVDRDALEGFEPAPNPDGNTSLGETVAGATEAAVWSVRAFVSQVLDHPLRAVAAVGVILLGAAADQTAALPESFGAPLLVLGALGLAVVGTGRF